MNHTADSPLVSVIIPMYNSERFVAAAIESALAQTWKNVEIIVVDDGSSDSSLEIARSFEPQGVQVVAQRNSGSAAARNTGGERSQGVFIQYLDADDLLKSDKIERQLDLLKTLPDGYVSSSSWGRFTEAPEEARFEKQAVWEDMSPVEWLTTAWLGGGMMQTACWLTPKRLIQEAGPWNESFKKNPNDDGEFFCRVLLKSRGIKFCGAAQVYYRSHAGERVSTHKGREAVQSLLDTCISYEEHIRQHDGSPTVVKALVNNYASFIYLYANLFPDLAATAELRIKALGVARIPVVGGKFFQKAAALIGFKTLLKLRAVIKKY